MVLLLSIIDNEALIDFLSSALLDNHLEYQNDRTKKKTLKCDKIKMFLNAAETEAAALLGADFVPCFSGFHSKWDGGMVLQKNIRTNWKLQFLLVMYNHGSITVGSFLFDDADQFKSFTNRTIRIWPFWTLKMPHFKYIVILKEWKKHRSIW